MQTIINYAFLGFFISIGISTICKRIKNRNRFRVYHQKSNIIIQSNKIIVAIDPINVLCSISATNRTGYVQLQIQRKGFDKLLQTIYNIFGYRITYYQVKEKKQNIDFLRSLIETKKVELCLYTTLQQQVAESLLKKLGLNDFFKKDFRVYCQQKLKHPTQVDSKTKRVLILTGSHSDYAQDDSKYFLLMKRKDLKKNGKALIDLILKNKDIDEFNTEFNNWKLKDFDDSSHE